MQEGTPSVARNYPLFRLANRLYRCWPSLYVALYGLYKHATEREERQALGALVRPGMLCVDVGANIGFTTKVLSGLAGPRGRVLAFEPSPENFAILSHRVREPNVELVQAAVGDSTGEISLYVSDDLNVDHRAYPAENARRQISVRQTTLDEATQGSEVDFVKIDTQGYELHVLKGMTRILKSASPLSMIVEFWPWGLRQAGDDPRDVIALLRAHGLTVTLLSGGPIDAWRESPTWYRNLLARRS